MTDVPDVADPASEKVPRQTSDREASAKKKKKKSKKNSRLKFYRQLKRIGKGSYGVVDLVRGKDNRLYVMKVVQNTEGKMSQGGHLQEARAEAEMLQTLRHPNIVEFHEAFVESRYLCLVMAYCKSGDLKGRVKRAKSRSKLFKEQTIMDWFVQMCFGLNYMHKKHIMHRDLKPQNVFLTENNKIVKLGDFGVTRELNSTQALAKTQVGTPYYMSPELARNEQYSFQSDVWALGCILSETCTLSVPFDAENFSELVTKITKSQPRKLHTCYSLKLHQLVASMLSKDPNERPTIDLVLRNEFVQSHIRSFSERYQEHYGRVQPVTPNLDAYSPMRRQGDHQQANNESAELHGRARGHQSAATASGTVTTAAATKTSDAGAAAVPASSSSATPRVTGSAGRQAGQERERARGEEAPSVQVAVSQGNAKQLDQDDDLDEAARVRRRKRSAKGSTQVEAKTEGAGGMSTPSRKHGSAPGAAERAGAIDGHTPPPSAGGRAPSDKNDVTPASGQAAIAKLESTLDARDQEIHKIKEKLRKHNAKHGGRVITLEDDDTDDDDGKKDLAGTLKKLMAEQVRDATKLSIVQDQLENREGQEIQEVLQYCKEIQEGVEERRQAAAKVEDLLRSSLGHDSPVTKDRKGLLKQAIQSGTIARRLSGTGSPRRLSSPRRKSLQAAAAAAAVKHAISPRVNVQGQAQSTMRLEPNTGEAGPTATSQNKGPVQSGTPTRRPSIKDILKNGLENNGSAFKPLTTNDGAQATITTAPSHTNGSHPAAQQTIGYTDSGPSSSTPTTVEPRGAALVRQQAKRATHHASPSSRNSKLAPLRTRAPSEAKTPAPRRVISGVINLNGGHIDHTASPSSAHLQFDPKQQLESKRPALPRKSSKSKLTRGGAGGRVGREAKVGRTPQSSRAAKPTTVADARAAVRDGKVKPVTAARGRGRGKVKGAKGKRSGSRSSAGTSRPGTSDLGSTRGSLAASLSAERPNTASSDVIKPSNFLSGVDPKLLQISQCQSQKAVLQGLPTPPPTSLGQLVPLGAPARRKLLPLGGKLSPVLANPAT